MKNKLLLLSNMAIIFMLFLFGNSMTTTPGASSGNGNPAILLLIPIFMLFIILILQWVHLLKNMIFSLRTFTILLISIVIHFTVGIYYQVIMHSKYRDVLATVYKERFGVVDWEYINSITTGFTIHINNQFFNCNTYFMLVSLSIFFWGLSNLIKGWFNKKTRQTSGNDMM
ncbi:hypothetical protein [Paenibacillus dakarensis]|uniref:hypothetical protein n=1 Tax=Paenibacillus dakarensis TaxID=1527293 RepID=UPI0012E10CD7|nr:hypothetical protein [Paenibacillus dakarensis]